MGFSSEIPVGLILFFSENRKITRLSKASIQREQNPSERNQKFFQNRKISASPKATG